MKGLLKNIVFRILKALARRQLRRSHPQVIGVTGSAGKTSSKEAIFSVLERRFRVKRNKGSFNSDFGVALSILDLESGYSSPSQWVKILFKALWRSLQKVEPLDYLVQEMGVDKPGDMDKILELVKPDIMVFLNVKNVHRGKGQFENKEAILKEKSKACFAVRPGGWVILNGDDLFTEQLATTLSANVLKFGLSESCELKASQVKSREDGLSFILNYGEERTPIHMPNILGECHVEAALTAAAVGFLTGLPLAAIQMGLKEFQLPAGRMNPIEGLNGSLLIDSSYNASPDTMEAALDVLGLFKSKRRIAALGSMNELGELSSSSHVKVGALAAEKANELIAVGANAREIAEGAHSAGMPANRIFVFSNSKEAGEFLKERLQKNDVVLAKGSQNGVRMERLVKLCMKHPEQSRQLLVRQDVYWMEKN